MAANLGKVLGLQVKDMPLNTLLSRIIAVTAAMILTQVLHR